MRVAHLGHRLELEARIGGRAFERREIALAPGAVAEIAPHQQPGGLQSAAQHVLDERFRRERREARVEARDMSSVEARGGEQFQLLAQARDARGRRRAAQRGKMLARQGLESERACGEALAPRHRDHAREHRLMTEVHAVEVSDRPRARPAAWLRCAVRDHHGAGSKC